LNFLRATRLAFQNPPRSSDRFGFIIIHFFGERPDYRH